METIGRKGDWIMERLSKNESIVVKYYSPKMLLTVDFEFLMGTLFAEFGSNLSVLFEPMSPQEMAEGAENIGGVDCVRERVHILRNDSGELRRLSEIENEISKVP